MRICSLHIFFLSSLMVTSLTSITLAAPSSTKAETSVEEVVSKTPQTPESQWAYSNMLALRYNPLGLQDELYFGFKQRLYDVPQDNLLLGKSYWWAGLVTRASPQFLMSGLFFRTLPIAILELQGVFARVQGLADAADLPGYYTQGTKDAVNTTKSSRVSGGSLIANGWQGSLQARLQAKVGHIAFRSTNLLRHFNLNADGGATTSDLFYDQTLDLVTPLKSWVYQSDTDLLYANANKPWVLGVRHTYATVLTEANTPDIDADRLYDIHRAGLLFAWKFKAPITSEGLEAKRRHALIVLSQWHLDHPFRTGQSMNTSIPYFAVVYALSGRVGD